MPAGSALAGGGHPGYVTDRIEEAPIWSGSAAGPSPVEVEMSIPPAAGTGGPPPAVPQPAPPRTMAQTLTALVAEQQTLDVAIRAALRAVPASPAVDAVTAALDTLGRLRTVAGRLAAFTDAEAGDAQYQVAGGLRAGMAGLVAALGGVPALAPALTVTASGLVASCQTLAGRMLPVITALHAPRLGYPSVGFEYELPYVQVETQVPAKTLIARWMDGQVEDVRLETDGGHVEFVTAPVATLADLNRQLGTIRTALNAMRATERISYRVPVDIRSAEDGTVIHAAGYEVTVRHGEGGSSGRVQGTAACALADIPEMITMHANGLGLDAFDDDPAHPGAVALARLVNYYIRSLQPTGSATDQQGPKVMLPVMCRTSLHTLYAALPAADKTQFQQLIGYQTANTNERGNRLVRNGYLGPGGARCQGPLVGEWVDSIVDGQPTAVDTEPFDRDNDGAGPRGPQHDLMSPPPGYPAHRKGRHFTYAMGYFGTAPDGSALLEVREIWTAGLYTLANFEAQAREFLGHRSETVATRHARVSAVVDAAVAQVCGTRAARAADRAQVRTRLDTRVSRCERPLAYALVQSALDNYVPPAPPPDPVPGSKRRAGRDDEDDQSKRQKTQEAT